MQAFKSLFSRNQTPAAEAPAVTQPTPLPTESLKLVGGGLPRIGGLGGSSATVDETVPQADALPPVA